MINQYPPFDFIYTQVNWVIAKQEIYFFGLFSLMMGFMLWWIYHISERLRLTEEREIRRRGEEIRIRIRMANGQLLAMALDSSSEMDSEDEEVEDLVLTSPMSTEAIMV